MINLDIYEKLDLKGKKEYIESLLDNEFELGNDFDGVVSKKATVTHKKCGKSQNIRISGLLIKKNRCDYCYEIERENNFKEIVSPQLELISKYKNADTPVEVKIKRCGHTKTVVPYVVAKSVKKGKTIKCEKCLYEQKKETLKKYIAECCSYEGEYTLVELQEESNTPIGVRHNKCGEVEYYEYKQILMRYVNCKFCKNEKSKDKFVDKLKYKYKIADKYKLRSKYSSTNKPVILEHECGCKRYILPSTLDVTPNIKCRWCDFKDFFNTEEVKTFLFYKTKGEYQLLNEYNPNDKLMYLKKRTCNHKFTINSSKFFDHIHCPVCKKNRLLEKKHNEFVEQINKKYKGRYQVLSRFKGTRYLVDIVHLECGTIFSERAKTLLANNIKEPCKKCCEMKDNKLRKEKFLKRLEEKFNGEVILVGKFTNQRNDHLFQIKDTDITFTDKPYLLIKRKTILGQNKGTK